MTCSYRVYMILSGPPVRGRGEASRYVAGPYREGLASLLGCNPYPGTLNVEVNAVLLKALVQLEPCTVLQPEGYWRVLVYEALVYGVIPALLVVPVGSENFEKGIAEIVSCTRLWEYAERLGKVYVIVGCGLIRAYRAYLDAIRRLASLERSESM